MWRSLWQQLQPWVFLNMSFALLDMGSLSDSSCQIRSCSIKPDRKLPCLTPNGSLGFGSRPWLGHAWTVFNWVFYGAAATIHQAWDEHGVMMSFSTHNWQLQRCRRLLAVGHPWLNISNWDPSLQVGNPSQGWCRWTNNNSHSQPPSVRVRTDNI